MRTSSYLAFAFNGTNNNDYDDYDDDDDDDDDDVDIIGGCKRVAAAEVVGFNSTLGRSPVRLGIEVKEQLEEMLSKRNGGDRDAKSSFFFCSFDPTFEKKKSKINTKTKCVEQSINNKEMVQIYHEKKRDGGTVSVQNAMLRNVVWSNEMQGNASKWLL